MQWEYNKQWTFCMKTKRFSGSFSLFLTFALLLIGHFDWGIKCVRKFNCNVNLLCFLTIFLMRRSFCTERPDYLQEASRYTGTFSWYLVDLFHSLSFRGRNLGWMITNGWCNEGLLSVMGGGGGMGCVYRLHPPPPLPQSGIIFGTSAQKWRSFWFLVILNPNTKPRPCLSCPPLKSFCHHCLFYLC